MRILYIILVLIGCNMLLHAQNDSDISRIINTAFTDNGVLFLSQKSNQMQTLNYDIPLIEEIEVRSETNDFDLRKQDLVVRISPNTNTSRKAHRQYHESVKYMTQMEELTQVMKTLKERYTLIVNYVYTNEKLTFEKNRYTVFQDKVKLLKKMISLATFDIVELIEAEDNIYKIQRKIKNLESELNDLTLHLSTFTNEKITLKKEDLVSRDDIQSIIQSLISSQRKNHPEIEVLSARHYNAMMEHEWEFSKTKFSLGFVQAKFAYDPDEVFRNNFSLGFGFNFPLKGSSSLDINELKIKILDYQREYLVGKENHIQRAAQSFSRLSRLIEMHKLLQSQIKEGNAEYALKEYSKQKMASPLALLKLTELNVENEALLLDVESEILLNYLDYLYSTGDIGRQPYRNYLDPNLSLLQ